MAKLRILQDHYKDVIEAGIDAEELIAELKLTEDEFDDGIAGVMRLVMDTVTSERDGRMFETFVRVITKLSPSLGRRMNAMYRKQCDANTGEGCVEDGRDNGGGDDRGIGYGGSAGGGDIEANTSSGGRKRAIREDCDKALPPGKRLPLTGREITTGSTHTVKTEIAQLVQQLTSDGLSSKGATSDGPSSKGPTSDGPSSKGPTSDGPSSKGPTSDGPSSKKPTSYGPSSKGPTSKGPISDGPSSKGLTSDSLPFTSTYIRKEVQPCVVWRLGHLSCGLDDLSDVDTTDGPALSIWQLQGYQVNNQLNGEGIVVAIVDSGINSQHVALSDRVVCAQSFVPGESVEDHLGHGTMCAGIVCGGATFGGNSPWIGGVAPSTKLMVCKVVPDGSTQADLNAVCDALDFIQKYNTLNPEGPVSVVSLSFGTPYFNQAVCSRVHSISGAGVIVVCAASNDGRLMAQPIAFPARLGHVLCIGSHNSGGKPSPFSAVGREIDFLAPGEEVWAPHVGGPQAISCGSGTSYAAPAVAGLICLVLQYLKYLSAAMEVPLYHHACNVWVMRELLKEMATSPGHHSEELGYGTLVPERFFEKHPEEIKRIILKMVQ